MLKTLSNGEHAPWLGIPGVASFSQSLNPLAQSLADRGVGLVAVELIDLFRNDSALQSVAEVANCLENLMPDLVCSAKFTIVGHSFGGRVAYALGKLRADRGLKSHVVMIDALPCNFDGKAEPEDFPKTQDALLRWYVSTFPPAFAKRFAEVPDGGLAEALIASRVFRRDEVVSFVDAMRRQIAAHNSFKPESPAPALMKLDVIIPAAGIYETVERSHIEAILQITADRWAIHDASGDHYSILKMPDQMMRHIC